MKPILRRWRSAANPGPGHRYRLVAVILSSAVLCASLFGGAPTPPRSSDDICAIFEEKRGWYQDALAAERRWGTPTPVQMAIIKQESGFREDARPPRSTLLGFIPWTRPSTAYGYPQAKQGTWDWYIEKTGNRGADRDDFGDATDFIGWYTDMSQRFLKISKLDGYNQYLAYHEGHAGFRRRSYGDKAWLQSVARKVDAQARRYAAQLDGCRETLEHRWSWWPFAWPHRGSP